MRNTLILLLILLVNILFVIWYTQYSSNADLQTADELREKYSRPVSEWPEPFVEDSIDWEPLGPLPDSPYRGVDSLQALTDLGRVLFFDPRLSASNQISCSSCHDPNLGWSDGKVNSVGHDHFTGKRNSISLLNVWMKEPLFWDGRAETLTDQLHHPITDPIEMNQDVGQLSEKLQNIEGYGDLFHEAFEDTVITMPRIAEALTQFQRTIQSRKSDFDRFVLGDKDALSDRQLEGLHLFRTKAQCMNCHNGPLFSDFEFHNLGLHYYGREREDLGRFWVTGNDEDVGKFRTPQLRDVMFTAPWFHNGLFGSIEGVINMYNAGMARPEPRPGMKTDDPPYPTTSPLLQELNLTDEEMQAIIAFLESISETPYRMPRPELPGR